MMLADDYIRDNEFDILEHKYQQERDFFKKQPKFIERFQHEFDELQHEYNRLNNELEKVITN